MRVPVTRPCVAAFALLAAAAAGPSAPDAAAAGSGDGGFHLNHIAKFDGPTHADNAPGFPGAMFVVEREGVVRVVRRGRVLNRPFLDISGRVDTTQENGMASIAFHPGYRHNRRFYVFFTNLAGDNQVTEFRRAPRRPFRAVRRSARRVIAIPHRGSDAHNSGQMQFGRRDRLLYISLGDGAVAGAPSQDLSTLAGSIIRINPLPWRLRGLRGNRRGGRAGAGAPRRQYTIPRTNPFVRRPGRPAIWAYGLRNAFRFSFDARTGAIVVGDVGQACVEEINYRGPGRARGVNFGWPRFEGSVLYDDSVAAPGAIGPVHEYNNSKRLHVGPAPGECPSLGDYEGRSVIPGYVVRDPRLPAQWGRLLYGDFFNPGIRSLIPAEAGAVDDQETGVSLPSGGPVSFAEGARRKLYVLSLFGGDLYRLDP